MQKNMHILNTVVCLQAVSCGNFDYRWSAEQVPGKVVLAALKQQKLMKTGEVLNKCRGR